MAIIPAVITATLERVGYQLCHRTQKVQMFRFNGSGEPLYVRIDNKGGERALRIHPRHDGRLASLAVGGTVFEDEQFLSNMTEFPKKEHGGEASTHFGLGFTFESTLALEAFLSRLDRAGLSSA